MRLGQRLAWAPWRLSEIIVRQQLIPVDMAPSSSLGPRWGYGKPSHPVLTEVVKRHDDVYRKSLATIAGYVPDLVKIASLPGDDPLEPHWRNPMCPPLDMASHYAFIREKRPRRYVEVGSGHSTRFAARAVRDAGLDTEIISIDPNPRASVDELCAEIIRMPLEDYDLAAFRELGPGDILFFDCSHRIFTNSDVTVFFLEILPSLPPGLLIGVHDIFVPEDYPPDWSHMFYSEQYLLFAWMLANPDRLLPVLPCHYVSKNAAMGAELEQLWNHPNLVGAVEDARQTHAGELGMTFWFECGALPATDGPPDGSRS